MTFIFHITTPTSHFETNLIFILGQLYFNKHNYNKALKYFEESMEFFNKSPFQYEDILAYILL